LPTLSVLIPARNAQETIDSALESIATQTFGDWEMVVVDDGSTDATPHLLTAWARRDHRIRALRNDIGQGLVISLNRALAAATAPWIARMDADDLSLPCRFEWQLERMRVGDIAAVGCRVEYFPPERVADGARRYQSWLNSLITPEEHDRDLFVECPLAHPTFFVHGEILRRLGGYQARGWPEDYDLCLRLARAGHRLAKIPQTALLWREQADRTSRTHPDYSPEAFARCKASFLKEMHFIDGRPAIVFGAGPVGKSIARAVMAIGVCLQAFVEVDARKIGQRIYGAPVLSAPEGLGLRGKGFGLAAVGQPGGREELRAMLHAAGWEEGTDFRCVA
jgi:glycosyltransferase involved in cell wall biosynthesis